MAESWRICKICVTQLVSDSHVDSAQPRSPAKQSRLMSLVLAEIADPGGLRVYQFGTISFIAAIALADNGPIPLAFVYHIPFSVAGQ